MAKRQQAVLALMAGKATVDQLALRYGVRPATIEGWRQQALSGVEQALRQAGRTPRERELEKENKLLRSALTRTTMQKELLENSLEQSGGLVPIVVTVDCGCRSVLDVTVTDSQTAFDVLLAVERGRPIGNAVAERTIQTMKVERLWLEDFTDAAHV